MLSLKPPWRQENPLMEKACSAYYKNTAPAEAVKIFKDMKVVDKEEGKRLDGEIICNAGTKEAKSTLVLYTLGEAEYPSVIVEIMTGEKDVFPRIEATKIIWDRCSVYYKGEEVIRLDHGGSSTYKTYRV